MKINPEILKFAKVFFILDLCLVSYSLIFQSTLWLLSSQVAFFSSLFITIASFLSYKKNIENRLSDLDLTKNNENEDRDKIDEIDCLSSNKEKIRIEFFCKEKNCNKNL